MKVKELIERLCKIKKELQNKEIYVIANNGLLLEPEIKFLLKDNPVDMTKENVECIILGEI